MAKLLCNYPIAFASLLARVGGYRLAHRCGNLVGGHLLLRGCVATVGGSHRAYTCVSILDYSCKGTVSGRAASKLIVSLKE